MHSLSEVASLLGCRDPRRITKCMQIAGIGPQEDERDKRQRLLTDMQVERLREVYAHLYGPKQSSSADLETRMAALEAAIEQLRQRAPYLFTASTEARMATDEQLPPYAPPKRQIASTARYSHTSARPAIPPHLMSIPTWTERHGVRLGTIKTWREKGRLPVERGQWLENGVRIDTALTLDGRRVAHQLAGIVWPCEVCAGVEQAEVEETEQTEAATL